MDILSSPLLSGANAFLSPLAANPMGGALNRLTPMMPMPSMADPMMGMPMGDPMVLQTLIQMLSGLMMNQPLGMGMPTDLGMGMGMDGMGGFSGSGGGGGAVNGSSGYSGGSSYSGGGTSSSSGGSAPTISGGVTDSGPVAKGAQGMLDRAGSMLGMTETGNTADIQAITGKSGINPASTPWCSAFAINLMKDHGILDTEGLSNPNYVPTVSSWAAEKGIRGSRGSYTPKPGDAIMFDWGGDGTEDHIGLVEKVQNGKVITIEGNSSDSVKRNTYDLNDGNISGYVKSSDTKEAKPKPKPAPAPEPADTGGKKK